MSLLHQLGAGYLGLGGLGEMFFWVYVHAHWGRGFLNAFSTWRSGLDMTKTKSLVWLAIILFGFGFEM